MIDEAVAPTIAPPAMRPFNEDFRSLQLYGVDPDVTAAAVRMVGEGGLADHIDLNFGCPKLPDCQRPLTARGVTSLGS